MKASAYKGMTIYVLVSLVKNTRLPVTSLPRAPNFLHPPAPTLAVAGLAAPRKEREEGGCIHLAWTWVPPHPINKSSGLGRGGRA